MPTSSIFNDFIIDSDEKMDILLKEKNNLLKKVKELENVEMEM